MINGKSASSSPANMAPIHVRSFLAGALGDVTTPPTIRSRQINLRSGAGPPSRSEFLMGHFGRGKGVESQPIYSSTDPPKSTPYGCSV